MKFTNGNHTLQVTAYDVAGNAGTSTQVIVTTNNPTDNDKASSYSTSPATSTTTPKLVDGSTLTLHQLITQVLLISWNCTKDNVLIDTTSVCAIQTQVGYISRNAQEGVQVLCKII